MLRLSFLIILIACASCSRYEPKRFYEIPSEEEIQFQLTAFKNEPYYWEWINQEAATHVKLTSRIYSEATLSTQKYLRGKEIWVLEGTKPGTDTLKLHLRSYEEDSLNTPVADSLIIIVKVNEKPGL